MTPSSTRDHAFTLIRDPDDSDLLQRIRALRLVAFDFDGVFTNNMVYVFQEGTEAVRCCRSDGLGLRRLEAHAILPVIISTETNPVVQARSAKLQVACYSGCKDKVAVLEQFLRERGLDFSQAAFVGNDVNDLPCLSRVRLPIVVADAHPDVLHAAVYQTRRPGGHGAVREVCDLVVSSLETGTGA